MTTTKTVNVPNISCGHCVMTIQKEIGELEGVENVTASEETKRVTLIWNDSISWDEIAATLEAIGYPAKDG